MKKVKLSIALCSVLLWTAALSACAPSETLSASAVSSQSASSLASAASAEDPAHLSDEDASPEQENQVLEQLAEASVALAAPSSSGGNTTTGSLPVGSYAGTVNVRIPAASGTVVYQKGGSVIDASHTADGYVMIRNTGSAKRLKVQIKNASATYNYDLNNAGKYEVFPLQMGNGAYTARIMENVSGNSYRELFHADFNVALSSSAAPFLYPNQYVNYTASSAAVQKSYDLCAKATSDLDKLKIIYNYLTANIKYDYDKAATVKSGYLPNVDAILSSQKGICFDYSALMATMLRAQNVPTKLVIGSADNLAQDHSWNEVYLEGVGWITVKIQNTQAGWKLMDATFGASNATGSSYTAARVY